jgi:hypothetical protein
LRLYSAEDPPSIAIYDAMGNRLGRVSAQHHDEVDRILRVGLPLVCVLAQTGAETTELRLRFADLG